MYFIQHPLKLYYYFNDTLGRTLLLLFVILLTSCYSFIGFLFTFIVIVIYHSKVQPKVNPLILEGMENASIADKKKPSIPTMKTSIQSSSLSQGKESHPSPEKSTPTDISTSVKVPITQKPSVTKESYENIHTPFLPSQYGRERDNILRLEKMMRPRSSHTFMKMNQTDTSDVEPVPYYYGKNTSKSLSTHTTSFG